MDIDETSLNALPNLNEPIDEEEEEEEEATTTAAAATSKVYRYNCVRCNLVYTDLDLLKNHYFEKHINNSGSSHLNNNNDSNDIHPSRVNNLDKRTSKRTLTKRQSKKTKLSNSFDGVKTNLEQENANNQEDDDDDDLYDVVNETNNNTAISSGSSFRTNSSITIKKRRQREEEQPQSDLDKRISELSEEEMKTFNTEDIDEAPYIQAVGDGEYSKRRELLAGRVVWAYWRNIMWPALIVKVHTIGKTSSSLKVHIRYYEMSNKLGNVFKLDPSKVELFYKCKEHVHYKVLGSINKAQRKEFFVAYTNALKDYIEYLKTNKDEERTKETSVKQPTTVIEQPKKFHVLGKQLTLDEVKELAKKEYTEEQKFEIKKREEASKRLMDYLMDDDCKNFLIQIMTDKNTNCDRHNAYLSADTRTRRTKMKFTYIGPLTHDDSVRLGTYLKNLCKEHYLDKPVNLTTYEYDVIYPEAVIWSLRKLYQLSYKKAEMKWKTGFLSTKEEQIKRKCNEILNRLPPPVEVESQVEANLGDNDEGDNHYESEYNEDDTSFFTYCSNTDLGSNRGGGGGGNNLDKVFNETVSMINGDDGDEDNNDKENLELGVQSEDV